MKLYTRVAQTVRAFARLAIGWAVRIPPRVPFFETRYCPHDVAKSMVEECCFPFRQGVRFLEPSAGTGGISDLIYLYHEDVTAIELHGPHFDKLKNKPYKTIRRDFLTIEESEVGSFDYIISCPPFDTVSHLDHMKTLLRNNGQIIALVMDKCIDSYWRQFYTELNLDFKAPSGELLRCGIVRYSYGDS